MVLALALRLPGVGRDVWLDEAASVMDVRGVAFLPLISVSGEELTGASFQGERGVWGSYERVRVVHQVDVDPAVEIEPLERYFVLESMRVEGAVAIRTYRRTS